MIRYLKNERYTSDKRLIYAEGLSTDTKPTTGLITGSKFIEIDTGIFWVFDETLGWMPRGGKNDATKAVAANLATLTNIIHSQQGQPLPVKDVNLYDYDGTVLYSYSAEDFAGLTVFPPLPAHEGLLAQGWNWNLETAKTYVAAYGCCEIGATYTTRDAKTHAVIDIGDPESLTAVLKFQQSEANSVIIDWGDGSDTETAEGTTAVSVTHTYEAAGRYTITLAVPEGKTMIIGNNALYQAGFMGQGANGWCGRSILKELYIGERVTAIATRGLWMQSNLQVLTIPQGVTTIAADALESCIDLKCAVLPRGVTALTDYMFRTDYNLRVVAIPDTVTSIAAGAFATCVSLQRLTIPQGVANIPASTFIRCFKATVINVPDSVRVFGASCFEYCYDLLEIRVPSGVTVIPNNFARQCHSLRKCDLPEGVTTIKTLAFSGCFAFDDFTIPSTVTSIEGFAFLYNDGAATFHVLPTTPPTLEPTAFTETNVSLVIEVPYSADHSVLNAYLEATGWSGKGDNIVEAAE